MRYRDDWHKSQARFEAYWRGEIVDRCLVSVTAPPPPPAHDFPTAELRYRAWMDPEFIIERNRAYMERAYYAGDAFPQIILNLGASGHAGFFEGARYQFEDSIWFFPSLSDPDELAFDERSLFFQKALEMARAYVRDSGGDYFVSMPNVSGTLDALSHLMGPDGLMEAMLDDPAPVKRALSKIEAAYARMVTEVGAIISANNKGGTGIGWMQTWAPGLHAQMQIDMSVMISNEMFEDFAMPELRAQCGLLDYPLYHLDGVEQIRHLDSLLSLEKLRAIQWTQVAGQKPATEYIPELRKIQAAGKNLVILVSPGQIPALMENLSSRGLYMVTTVDTREEADAVVSCVEKLTRD